jgi:hypothetical protein
MKYNIYSWVGPQKGHFNMVDFPALQLVFFLKRILNEFNWDMGGI